MQAPNDAFVVKYNSSGTKQWTKQFGTSSTDLADGVAIDSSGQRLCGRIHLWRSWMVIPIQATVTSSWLSTTPVGQSNGRSSLGSSSRDYDY